MGRPGRRRAPIAISGRSGGDYPGTEWKWRKLDVDPVGIRFLKTFVLYGAMKSDETSMLSGDGTLCWLCRTAGMVLFDVHREIFRWVNFPPEVHSVKTDELIHSEPNDDRRPVVPRVCFSDNHLSIQLWLLPARGDKFKPEIDCFDLEDEGGKVWKKSSEKLSQELCEGAGSVMPDSSIMLISGRRRQLYCTIGMRRFWVGQLPDGPDTIFRKFSFLLHSNVLYLSLHDVLDGNGLI